MASLLNGITASKISLPDRIEVHYLSAGNAELPAVILIHGNVSSSLFYQDLMLKLATTHFVIAPDLRGFGESQTAPIDATRGVRDHSDDVIALLKELNIQQADFVGWSMGAGVVMQLAIDSPAIVHSMTLSAPISPFGFGGTSITGELLNPDASGTGGAAANPEFIKSLVAGDKSDSPNGPLAVMRQFYVADIKAINHESIYLDSMLSTKIGDDNYPGNFAASEHWPGFAPGNSGVLNSMSPMYFNTSGIVQIDPKPPVLWIRGDKDAIVNDASFFDLNTLGAHGIVPGWPGAELAPSQPMVSQMRTVLEQYKANGGSYREIIFSDCGHSPHLERPTEFLTELKTVLAAGASNQ
jgi:pimeloyl-ACP methyl ester carboxylesterase